MFSFNHFAMLRRVFRFSQLRTGYFQSIVRQYGEVASLVESKLNSSVQDPTNYEKKSQQVLSKNNDIVPPAAPPEYRFIYPEFLPSTNMQYRNKLREKLERVDMMQRRMAINIPEFYVGSVLAVTVADPNATNKSNRFVGICIYRGDVGLRHQFILRNVVDHQGVEILYDVYCPLIQKIEVLKLEKRVDATLFYLRDALPEYSTFQFHMEPEVRAEGAPVPINAMKVKLKPRPWLERYERQDLKGIEDLNLPQKFYDKADKVAKPWEKFDLMLHYRNTIPAEEQEVIYAELHSHVQRQDPRTKLRKYRDTSHTE